MELQIYKLCFEASGTSDFKTKKKKKGKFGVAVTPVVLSITLMTPSNKAAVTDKLSPKMTPLARKSYQLLVSLQSSFVAPICDPLTQLGERSRGRGLHSADASELLPARPHQTADVNIVTLCVCVWHGVGNNNQTWFDRWRGASLFALLS